MRRSRLGQLDNYTQLPSLVLPTLYMKGLLTWFSVTHSIRCVTLLTVQFQDSESHLINLSYLLLSALGSYNPQFELPIAF